MLNGTDVAESVAGLEHLAWLEHGAFKLYDASTWEPHQFLLFTVVVIGLLEVLAQLVLMVGHLGFERIPARGKPLDTLTRLDVACIVFNKLTTPMVTYHVVRFAALHPGHTPWRPEELSVGRLAALAALFVVYDLFYCLFHRALHLRSVYKYIHKHHHRQMAPVRGNVDAVNVHPFEFLVGEYLHLVAIVIVPSHIITVVLFLGVGGFLASLNHTRFDVNAAGLYSVKYHDVHHRLPETNYGQYIMLWDHIFRSFRPYKAPAKAS